MKKLLISTFAAAVLLLFGGVNEVKADPLTYEVVGDTVTIKDCKETASGELVIPSSYAGKPITSIGERAFSSCSSLTSVTIPDSVTSIGVGAFSGCSSLTSMTIPDSVTSIGNEAFRYCSSLTSVTIPDSVTSIGNEAFAYCGSLTSVTIPDSVSSIGNEAFRYCSSLTSVTIPDSVTSIGVGAFSGCSSLTSMTIPDSVTSIGVGAFSACSSLTSMTIPDSVTSIGSAAFLGCSSLTSVTIPDSVTRISNYTFYGCSSLTMITIEGNAPDTAFSIEIFKRVSETAKIIVNSDATGFGERFEGLPVVIKTNEPKILTITQLLSVMLFQRLELRVEAIGIDPLQYQWNKDGKPIPGAVTSAFVIDSSKLSDAGNYSVSVVNDYGATISDEIKVTIVPPEIRLQYLINEKGQFVLKAIGPDKSKVTFQFSEDFKSWTDQFTLSLIQSSTTIRFPISSGEDDKLFYRVKLVE